MGMSSMTEIILEYNHGHEQQDTRTNLAVDLAPCRRCRRPSLEPMRTEVPTRWPPPLGGSSGRRPLGGGAATGEALVASSCLLPR
jgi:hypothetical protein